MRVRFNFDDAKSTIILEPEKGAEKAMLEAFRIADGEIAVSNATEDDALVIVKKHPETKSTPAEPGTPAEKTKEKV